MPDFMPFFAAFLAGCLLGAFFFGGLWWTVRRVASSQHPAFMVFGSLLLRTGITLSGFYLAGDGDPARLAACLLGFALARMLVMRLSSPPAAPPTPPGSARQGSTAGDSPCA